MNAPRLEPPFRDGLRNLLIEHAATPEPRRPPRLCVISALSVSLLAVGGVAAAAGGLLPLPGGELITELGTPMSMTSSGTATLELASPPDGTTKVRAQVACLTAGTITLPAGTGSMTCFAEDAGGRTGVTWVDIPLDLALKGITIRADSKVLWTLTATFLNAEPLPLATNANGESYGIQDAPEGQPDLIAAVATNGKQGYVYAEELAEADGTNAVKTFRSPEDALAWQEAREGKTFSVPVYLSDGVTVIGEFVIG